MTDIVERLDVLGSYPEEREAKTEILRLRAECDGLRVDRNDWKNAADDLKVFIEKQQAEIEEIERLCDLYNRKVPELEREIERLRAVLESLLNECPRGGDSYSAECFQVIREIVAEALGDKP